MIRRSVFQSCRAFTIFSAVVAICVLSAVSPSETRGEEGGKVARLFILSGQSNAGGAGVGSELPAELKKKDSDVLMYGRHARGLQPLGPYGRKGYGTENTAFGAELVFSKEMKKAYPNDIICIAKQTKGGTSIIAWDKESEGDKFIARLKIADNVQKGAQYPLLMDTIKGAIEELKKRKGVSRVEVDAMLWIQSERDDHSEKTAQMYEENLRALIANVRKDLELPNLPFLYADANAHRNKDVIRAGMRRVAQETPHTAVVSIDGLSRHNEGVHYDTKGQLTLGQRFADAYLKMVAPEKK